MCLQKQKYRKSRKEPVHWTAGKHSPSWAHTMHFLFHNGGRQIRKTDKARKRQQFPAPMGRSRPSCRAAVWAALSSSCAACPHGWAWPNQRATLHCHAMDPGVLPQLLLESSTRYRLHAAEETVGSTGSQARDEGCGWPQVFFWLWQKFDSRHQQAFCWNYRQLVPKFYLFICIPLSWTILKQKFINAQNRVCREMPLRRGL